MKDLMLDDKMEMIAYILNDLLKKEYITGDIHYKTYDEDKYIIDIEIKEYKQIIHYKTMIYISKLKIKDSLAIEIAKEILEQIKNDLEF